MDAFIAAGGTPKPGELLWEETQGKPKAMLDLLGKPMIQWVLDALTGAELVDRIIIVGLDENQPLYSHKLVAFVPDHLSLLENVKAGMHKVLDVNPKADHALYVSADIPAITSEMVDWVIRSTQGTDHDGYYNVITRQVMETRYPTSHRSYIKFKDVEICGGDMNVLRTLTVTNNDELWRKIISSRKNALKQAALIGWDTAFLLLFRLITIDQAVKLATRRLKISAQAVVCPYAEVGMDVDKPFQLEIMRADLQKRMQHA